MRNAAIYPSLRERHVLITGGGSGIGAELTRAFVRQSARVSFLDVDERASHTLLEALEIEYPEARVDFFHCDLCDVWALRQAVAEAKTQHGPVGVLVNNAASDDRHDWREVTPDYWDQRMAVNLRPQFFAIQAVANDMIAAGGGSIVNFGSISWKLAMGGMPGYTTAKAAVHGLTRTMARELGASNIRVNTVIPGCIMTARQLEKWISTEDEARIQDQQCLKQRLLPEHVAPTVLFLAADDSRQCTAQEYVVDGGWC